MLRMTEDEKLTGQARENSRRGTACTHYVQISLPGPKGGWRRVENDLGAPCVHVFIQKKFFFLSDCYVLGTVEMLGGDKAVNRFDTNALFSCS